MCSSNSLEESGTLEIRSTSNEIGVVIFGVFTVDREFGTHPKLFLGSNYPITGELSSPKLCAYKPKPGPRLIMTFFKAVDRELIKKNI